MLIYIASYHIRLANIISNRAVINKVELVHYGHLGTNHKYTDYRGVLILQISLYDKAPIRTITRCVTIDYADFVIGFKCPD